ncbi:winged helix-turn-helix transcriptional regulator [Natrononativus amylolyticus]|uniref:winged helix-turn-helix transcriptional regulator n=1 Tax=Natrononativus amylolyticus TaxID=2963434 RepID=UPI0020CE0CBF|nr:winged helix-turn-helix transcriptional regulator [Natrononativus amylolyticus]
MVRHDSGVSVDDRVALDVLSLLSGKWHPVVVLTLTRNGPMGFNELLEAIPDVSGKVLSGTLEALSDAGLVRRRVVSESPLRVEYTLTAAGRDTESIFAELTRWGGRHLESTTPSVVLADGDRRITDMYGEWLTDRYTVFRTHNGDELGSHLEETTDVVIFDEGLPGVDPRDVPDMVGSTCRTIALVGDRPGAGLLEIECDDVLRKPVVRETVLEAIDEQLRRRGEPAARRDRAALAAKLELLESIHPRERLRTAEAYVDARERLADLAE